MAEESEGTPEQFARMAAQLRGQEPEGQDAEPDAPRVSELAARKRQRHRELVEAMHPADPEGEPDEGTEGFRAELFAPKPGHVEIVRSLHPDE
jgi:hypothetical protein